MADPALLTKPLRNRVIGHGEEDVDQLLANPFNFRLHPEYQQHALAGAIDEIGYIHPVLVNKTTGRIIDGHLRIELALRSGVKKLPVSYVELSEDEERLALLSLDPIAAMAATDKENLDALLREVQTDDARVLEMLDALAESAGINYYEGERADVENKTLAERFLVPPFSVLDARQGYWQERKNAWISLGIQSELGRGDVGGFPHGPSVTQNPDGTLQYRGASKDQWHKVAPGGSPRPSAKLGADGKTKRGDGRGRTLKSRAGKQADAQAYNSGGPGDLGRQYKGGLTFVTGVPRKDEVSGKILASGRKPQPADTYNERFDEKTRKALGAYAVIGQSALPLDREGGTTGTSIFDPVLCELAYRWFCPAGASILDPFAGGSVRGIVAALLGHDYTGIDLRPEQVAANETQAETICKDKRPAWIIGDSRDLLSLIPEDQTFDFVFSCPPYFDLEIYSDDERDLSNAGDYAAFLRTYHEIISASVSRLRDNRFACFVVGDLRDKRGFYRNFVSDTIDAFQSCGALLYNEAILVTAIGSLSIRVGRQFQGYRKLGKTHQNVLVFYKGDPKAIKAFGDVEVGEPTTDN